MMLKVATSRVCMALFGLLLVLKSTICKELLSAPFHVKPGGQKLTHVETLEDHNISCEFTYECQGGTVEEWEMLITEVEDTMVCRVSRPDDSTPSYLFFQSFEMKIKGATLWDGIVLGENGDKCDSDEYLVNTDNNLVRSDSKFKSHLNKVFAVFKKDRDHRGRDDL